MTEESLTIRIGYNPLTMRFFTNGSAVLFVFMIVLYYVEAYSLIPLLFVAACMMAEVRWRMRKKIALVLSGNKTGLHYGKQNISWDEITHYDSWGPLGIPLTPFRYRGICLYVSGEKEISLNSTYRGFEEICELLDKKNIPKTCAPPFWYRYPIAISRSIRYIIAYIFCILYSVLLSFSLLIIPIAYFVYRRKKATDKKDGFAEDTWISVLAGIVFLLIAFYLLRNSFITSLICFIPAVLILWLPWKDKPICLDREALFVGRKQAYPLRHLRTVKTITKYLLLRYQRLSFAHGDVDVYPYLLNYETFKNDLEKKWGEVQKKYQGKNYSEEEAMILSPEEEAIRLGVPKMNLITETENAENNKKEINNKEKKDDKKIDEAKQDDKKVDEVKQVENAQDDKKVDEVKQVENAQETESKSNE